MLFRLLRRIVVWLAKALERPAPKLVGIAVMSFNVVADFRHFDLALQAAVAAQRLNGELVLADRLPSGKAIPATPGARLF